MLMPMLVPMLMLLTTQRLAVERMEKLGEQLEEARKLRQSIFRRGDAVFAILSRYVPIFNPQDTKKDKDKDKDNDNDKDKYI